MKKMLEKLKKIRNLKPRQMLKLATAQMRLLNLADLWYFMETKPFHTRLQLMNFYSTLFPQVNTDTTYSVYINYLNGKRLKEIHGALKTNETKYIELADVLEGTGCSEGTLYWVISPPLTVRKEAWKLGIRQFHDRGYISYHSDKGGYSVIHGISSYVQHGKNARRLKKVYSRLDQEPFVTGVMIDTDNLTSFSLFIVNRSKEVSEGTVTFYDIQNGKETLQKEFRINADGGVRIRCDTNDIAKMRKSGGTIFYFSVEGLATEGGRPILLREYGDAFSFMHC